MAKETMSRAEFLLSQYLNAWAALKFPWCGMKEKTLRRYEARETKLRQRVLRIMKRGMRG